jgi:hypothetical protein
MGYANNVLEHSLKNLRDIFTWSCHEIKNSYLVTHSKYNKLYKHFFLCNRERGPNFWNHLRIIQILNSKISKKKNGRIIENYI